MSIYTDGDQKLILLFLIALIYVIIGTSAPAFDDRISLPSLDYAIVTIQAADRAGVDTSQLVSRLNIGIQLLEQGNNSQFDSCSSASDCTNRANQIFLSVTEEANELRNKADFAANLELLSSIAYSIIISSIIPFIAIYCYNKWKSLELKRFMDMEIRVEQ